MSIKAIRFFLICLILLSFQSIGQGGEEDFNNGKVELLSGEMLSGNITYEVATSTVKFINRTLIADFNARSISYFEFYDYNRDITRRFYSLLYNNNPTFFELLKETPKIALLSKENISASKAIAYLANKNTTYGNTSESVSNSETLYLADEKGNILPYVVISSSRAGTNSSYVSPYLLSTLTRRKYSEIRKYARENRYSLKNKEDLIAILEYYEQLK